LPSDDASSVGRYTDVEAPTTQGSETPSIFYVPPPSSSDFSPAKTEQRREVVETPTGTYAGRCFLASIPMLMMFATLTYAIAGTEKANNIFYDVAMALWTSLFRQTESSAAAPVAGMLTLSAATFIGGATFAGSKIKLH